MGKVNPGLHPGLLSSFPVVAYLPPAPGSDKAGATKCASFREFSLFFGLSVLACAHAHFLSCFLSLLCTAHTITHPGPLLSLSPLSLLSAFLSKHTLLTLSARCFVCQEDFAAGDKIRLLPCLHSYHQVGSSPPHTHNTAEEKTSLTPGPAVHRQVAFGPQNLPRRQRPPRPRELVSSSSACYLILLNGKKFLCVPALPLSCGASLPRLLGTGQRRRAANRGNCARIPLARTRAQPGPGALPAGGAGRRTTG